MYLSLFSEDSPLSKKYKVLILTVKLMKRKKKKKKSDIFSKHFAHNLASEITMPYADPEIYDVGFGSRT